MHLYTPLASVALSEPVTQKTGYYTAVWQHIKEIQKRMKRTCIVLISCCGTYLVIPSLSFLIAHLTDPIQIDFVW